MFFFQNEKCSGKSLARETFLPQCGNPHGVSLKALPSSYRTKSVLISVFLKCLGLFSPAAPLIHSYVAWKNLNRIRTSPAAQKDAPEMTLKQSEINLSNPSHCGRKALLARARAVAGAVESGIRMASFIFLCKLPDSLRRDGSKEQNKTPTCMTE